MPSVAHRSLRSCSSRDFGVSSVCPSYYIVSWCLDRFFPVPHCVSAITYIYTAALTTNLPPSSSFSPSLCCTLLNPMSTSPQHESPISLRLSLIYHASHTLCRPSFSIIEVPYLGYSRSLHSHTSSARHYLIINLDVYSLYADVTTIVT